MVQKFFLLFAVIAVIAIISVSHYTGYLEKSLFGVVINQFTEPAWDEIHPRYVVKQAIPVTILGDNVGRCLLYAQFFDRIIDQESFIRGDELAKKLNYDRENETITVDCSELKYTKSKIVIWYVEEDSPIDSKKYQYWFEEVAELNTTKP